MRPHFAHYKNEACNIFSEGETAEHIQGKLDLLRLFEKEKHQVELEGYLPTLKQRPDLLVNKLWAVEFQCSQIPIQKMMERTIGYLQAGYKVLWILGDQFEYKKQLTAFQKASLTENVGLYHYSVNKKRLTVTKDIKMNASGRLKSTKKTISPNQILNSPPQNITHSTKSQAINYHKRHTQLQRTLRYATTHTRSFQELLYENQESIISMPRELYHPVAHEWMIQTNSYLWKYQFILWLETFPSRKVITQKMIRNWTLETLTYYVMPQLSDATKLLPILEFIQVLTNSKVLKKINTSMWSLQCCSKRYKYLEEKLEQKRPAVI